MGRVAIACFITAAFGMTAIGCGDDDAPHAAPDTAEEDDSTNPDNDQDDNTEDPSTDTSATDKKNPCPENGSYMCVPASECSNGSVSDEYTCPGDDVCCSGGYKTMWKCLICD